MEDIIRNGMIGIAEMYRDEFTKKGKDGFEYLKILMSHYSTVGVLNYVYMIMIKEGRCLPIEMLDNGEKTQLWEEARRLSKIREKKHLINVCKALHAFGTFISIETTA